jgi:signal transduction histidine kinase
VPFLTAREALTDRLSGFSAGGDDYLTKPFDIKEQVARLQALVRRANVDGRVLITVHDDGPVVAEQDRERVFEPGSRNGPDRRNGQGAGLGLALARRLARAAGGDVYAEASGHGGRFAVRLPSG